MTMLDRMRRHKNWLKWSLALVVLAFVFFYVPDFLRPRVGEDCAEGAPPLRRIHRGEIELIDRLPHRLADVGVVRRPGPDARPRGAARACRDERLAPAVLEADPPHRHLDHPVAAGCDGQRVRTAEVDRGGRLGLDDKLAGRRPDQRVHGAALERDAMVALARAEQLQARPGIDVEPADVDPEFERVRRDDAQDLAIAETAFDRSTFRGQVAAAISANALRHARHGWIAPSRTAGLAGMFAAADEVVVTGDSMSMVTEAVLTGKPVGLLPLDLSDKGARKLGVFAAPEGSGSKRRDMRRFWARHSDSPPHAS